MKKSSLKNYITLLEAAADSATHARDYWMREHDRRVEELLEANASDYLARQYELLEARNHIAELERRLDDNGGICTLRATLTAETCQETIKRLREDNERLWEDNERLSALLRSTEHNHAWRVLDDPQA